jgi:Beta-propeller repeat/Cep192 domain 4/HYDIN/CFA65/VesB-like, Ig-like domain
MSGRTRRALLLAGAVVLAVFPPGESRRVGREAFAARKTVGATRKQAAHPKTKLSFEANQGQTDSRVKFLSRGSGYALFLTGDGMVMKLAGRPKSEHGTRSPDVKPTRAGGGDWNEGASLLPVGLNHPRASKSKGPARSDVIRMKLIGANPAAKTAGLDELPGKANYFIGSDPAKWRHSVPTYSRVRFSDVYHGIDLIYYGNQGQLEYDFVVAPGADPRGIRFHVAADSIRLARGLPALPRIARNGDLVIQTKAGEVRFHKPVVYQDIVDARSQKSGEKLEGTDNQRRTTYNRQSPIENRKFVDGRYVLISKNEIRFDIGSYDHTKSLVIDPYMAYLAYFGGTGTEHGYSVAVDDSGNAYVAGWTESVDFPTTAGALDTTCGSDGTCNPQNQNPDDQRYGDGFVSKINPDGTQLLYSTYLGGSSFDTCQGIAVDSSGNAYVVGWTVSADFPTVNPLQSSLSGGGDAFVAKINPTGTTLTYSTYLGGSAHFERGVAIALDHSGFVYVVGATSSTDFPITKGAFQTVNSAGNWTGFTSKLAISDSGSTLLYSTYLGGSILDFPAWVTVTSAGNIYVCGYTFSPNFPTSPGAFQTVAGGYYDAFISELSPGGKGSADLLYSSYLGGNFSDFGVWAGVDSQGQIWVTGSTNSADFPSSTLYPEAGLSDCGSSNDYSCLDAFVTKLNPAGAGAADLDFSEYLGGTGQEIAYGGALDSSGNGYLMGFSASSDFPTVNAIQPHPAGGGDGFVAEVSPTGTLLFSSYFGGSNFEWPIGMAVDGSGNIYMTGLTASTDFLVTPNNFNNLFGSDGTYHGGGNDAFVLKISPDIGIQVGVSRISLAFPGTFVGEKAGQQPLTLGNFTSAPLNLTSIQALNADGSLSQDFAVSPGSCIKTYNPGDKCQIQVTFNPQSAGTLTADVTLTAALATQNTPTNQTVRFAARDPRSISQTSSSSSPFKVPGTGKGDPSLSFSSNPLDFGPQTVGTPASKALTVTNVSDQSSQSQSFSITGVSIASSDFSLTNNGCTSGLAPATGCDLGVTFNPSATGTRGGLLTVQFQNTSDSNTGLLSVILTGSGGGFSLAASPNSKTVTAGQSATFTISATPAGGFNQPVNLTCSVSPVVSRGPACNVSPTPVTPDGINPSTATVTVTTTARSNMVPNSDRPTPPLSEFPWSVWFLASAVLMASLVAKARFSSARHLKPVALMALAACLLVIAAWTGCGGGGGGGGGSSSPPATGTPAGNYTITVSGTSGTLSSTTTFTLTVQ